MIRRPGWPNHVIGAAGPPSVTSVEAQGGSGVGVMWGRIFQSFGFILPQAYSLAAHGWAEPQTLNGVSVLGSSSGLWEAASIPIET